MLRLIDVHGYDFYLYEDKDDNYDADDDDDDGDDDYARCGGTRARQH